MNNQTKVLFVSLGCDKNLVDSEHMIQALLANGFVATDDESEAEAVVINTCCFIHDAKEESIETILKYADLKKDGQLRILAVTGCLAQRYQEEIRTEIPEVDVVLGTNSIDRIAEALKSAFDGGTFENFAPLADLPKTVGRRVGSGLATGYLKIAEGCDKHCTYCIIPTLRGSYRSVPMEKLVSEAASLAEAGVKELILVAQETTLYGVDLYGKKSLHRLLEKLCGIEGLVWIRVLYCYPEEIYPELIHTMKVESKICHYLDLPIQHANDRILKRMGRRTTKAELADIIATLRSEIPDIVLRTTLISGFPGETDEEHRELVDFVSDMAFDRLGVFTYSREEGTPAAEMEDQIDEQIKEARRDEIMQLQQKISAKGGRSRIGSVLPAMVEGKMPDEGVYVTRTYADAPSIDGYLFVETQEQLMTGAFVNAYVTGSMEYDLIGEIDEYTEQTDDN